MTRTDWIFFALLSLIWGVPYFFIKIALHDLSPAWIAFSRVALGAVLLAACVPRKDWSALRIRASAIIGVAIADIAIPFYLIANGERYVSSALTGLLLAAIPLFVAVLALLLDRSERLSVTQVIGLCIGLAGVAVLLGFNLGHDRTALTGAAMITGATLSYSVGVLLIKRWLHDVPMLATTAAMLTVAAALLAPPALLALPRHLPGLQTFIAIIILGVLCTAAAYVMYFALIGDIGPTRASVVTYVNPAVAAILGVALLHESMGMTAVAGLALVLAGTWFSTAAKRPDAPSAIGAQVDAR